MEKLKVQSRDSGEKKVVCFNCLRDVYDDVKRYAAGKNVSISMVITEAVSKYVRG